MDEYDCLAERFETHRAHLKAVACRLLGSSSDADDAVQESWLRLNRADATVIDNLRAWLTAVVAHVCFDMLRLRKRRREEALDRPGAMPTVIDYGHSNPEREALLAESVSQALFLVLDAMAPAERVAFVLHDALAMPFHDLAPIVGRSPEAARQLASRGRRRLQRGAADCARGRARRELLDAFRNASRHGEFDALLALLDPNRERRPNREPLPATAREPHRHLPLAAGKWPPSTSWPIPAIDVNVPISS